MFDLSESFGHKGNSLFKIGPYQIVVQVTFTIFCVIREYPQRFIQIGIVIDQNDFVVADCHVFHVAKYAENVFFPFKLETHTKN